MLEIRDLHAFYGESHILHGVGLEVRKGEVVTMLGLSIADSEIGLAHARVGGH